MRVLALRRLCLISKLPHYETAVGGRDIITWIWLVISLSNRGTLYLCQRVSAKFSFAPIFHPWSPTHF